MESKENVRENEIYDEPLININEDDNQCGAPNPDSGFVEKIEQTANEQCSSQAHNGTNIIDESIINNPLILPSAARSSPIEQKPQSSASTNFEERENQNAIQQKQEEKSMRSKTNCHPATKTSKLSAPTTLQVTRHSRTRGDIARNSRTKDSTSLSRSAGNSGTKGSRSQSTISGTPTSTRDRSLTTPVRWKAESKIGSLQNAAHRPGGGSVKIESKKLQWNVQSKVGSLEKASHTPGGGDKKIQTIKLEWKADSKVGSLDNAKHRPGGGDVKILDNKVDYSKIASSKVGSLEKAQHKPGGGNVKIVSQKLDFSKAAASKIGSLDNAAHKPGGGQVKIRNEKLNFDNATSKIGSKPKSGSEALISEM